MTAFLCENLTESDRLEGLGLDGNIILTIWPWKWTFKQYHIIYVKCDYFTNQKKYSYEIHNILQRNKLRLFSKSQKNIIKYKKYRQPTRCNNNGLLIIPVSSTCFGQLFCPKHVELTGIINMPLLLHLVGCLYYLHQ